MVGPGVVMTMTWPPLVLVASKALIVVPAGNASSVSTENGVPGPFDESTNTLPSALYPSALGFGATANGCETCGAGAYVALPAWLALITQVPASVLKCTVFGLGELSIVQPEVDEPSIVKLTGSIDVAVAEI